MWEFHGISFFFSTHVCFPNVLSCVCPQRAEMISFHYFSTREDTSSGNLFSYWRRRICFVWVAELHVDCVYFLSTASMTSVANYLILVFWYQHHYAGISPPSSELGGVFKSMFRNVQTCFLYYNNSQKKGNIFGFLTLYLFWSIMKKPYFFLTFISF